MFQQLLFEWGLHTNNAQVLDLGDNIRADLSYNFLASIGLKLGDYIKIELFWFTVNKWLSNLSATLEVMGSRSSFGDITEINFLKSI